ncbi:MAG TPA: hypothetical protein VKB43_12435 [Gaiellaceae bacterium]|nr:hypothetical protein [Gaiellaceae bacterium]
MRGVALLVCVAAAAIAAVGVARAAQSPRAVRASIVNAARAQQSVHYKTSQIIGNGLLTLTGDVEAADGTQHVSLKVGKKTAHLAIVVSDQTAYVQGDAAGLQALQGLTKTQASTYAGQWISIPKGDKDYDETAADVTLGSLIQLSTPRGHLVARSRKFHGKRLVAVIGITGKGKKKEVQVLAAPRKGKRLPVEEDELSPGQEYISHTVFGRWNEAVQVPVPASSVPISTVRG